MASGGSSARKPSANRAALGLQAVWPRERNRGRKRVASEVARRSAGPTENAAGLCFGAQLPWLLPENAGRLQEPWPAVAPSGFDPAVGKGVPVSAACLACPVAARTARHGGSLRAQCPRGAPYLIVQHRVADAHTTMRDSATPWQDVHHRLAARTVFATVRGGPRGDSRHGTAFRQREQRPPDSSSGILPQLPRGGPRRTNPCSTAR